MCTDTPQRYLRRILVSDFKQTKRWPIIPSLRRCQCSPPPAYLSMCTDTPQRYLRRILILDFKQKNAGRPFSFQNRFSLLWQPCWLPNLLVVISYIRGKYIYMYWYGTAVCIGLYTRYQYIFYLGTCTLVHGSLLYMHICVTTAVCM